jgi:hypothetical protein
LLNAKRSINKKFLYQAKICSANVTYSLNQTKDLSRYDGKRSISALFLAFSDPIRMAVENYYAREQTQEPTMSDGAISATTSVGFRA